MKLKNYRKGRIETEDCDGTIYVEGWGSNLDMSQVRWTREIKANSCSNRICETPQEAATNLAAHFEYEAEEVQMLIKHLQKALKELRAGAKNVRRLRTAGVSVMLAKYCAEKSAKAEVAKLRKIRALREEMKAARKGV